jgi:hypothetical protein
VQYVIKEHKPDDRTLRGADLFTTRLFLLLRWRLVNGAQGRTGQPQRFQQQGERTRFEIEKS